MLKRDSPQAPYFSIAIATYNAIEDLKKCVASITAQTFIDYELLISDGGSSDGTAEFLHSGAIERLAWFKSANDGGIYDALNCAVEEATGRWLIVLGSDDRFADANSLRRAHDQIQASGMCAGIAYFDLFIQSDRKTRLKLYPELEEFARRYGGSPPIHHQAAFIAGSSLARIGKFNLKYRLHSDYDLMMRVLAADGARKFPGALVVFSCRGRSSRLSTLWMSFREMCAIRRSFGSRIVPGRLLLTFGAVFFRALPNALASAGGYLWSSFEMGKNAHRN